MKTRIYIISIISMVAIAIHAQSFSPANLDNSFKSHQIMKGGAIYQGAVYEPFVRKRLSSKVTIRRKHRVVLVRDSENRITREINPKNTLSAMHCARYSCLQRCSAESSRCAENAPR